MKLFEKYLFEMFSKKKPKVLYHAADRLTKTLKPRLSRISIKERISKHGSKTIDASSEKLYAFGLERVNMLIPNKFTESEVRQWNKSSWLKPEYPRIILYYWNHIPKNPVYLYHLDPKDFKPFEVKTKSAPGGKIYHWYTEKEVTPLKVEKINPFKLKNVAWKKATDKEWQEKMEKYKRKGAFK